MSFPPGTEMFQFPGFASKPLCVQDLDTFADHPYGNTTAHAMPSPYERSKVGFPIRRSSDQRQFAAPQGLSQRTTSFIASQRQGIHRTPFWHLIALMIHARSSNPA